MGTNMNASVYQQEIYNQIGSGEPTNIVVEAVAGSGKTTTAVHALNLIPPSRSVMFCAFNKHIAEELSKRVPSNVRCSTLNSFGFSVCRNNIRYCKVDANKVRNIYWRLFDGRLEKNVFYKIMSRVIKLVSLMKAYGLTYSDQGTIDYLVDRYDFIIDEYDFINPAIQVLIENNRTESIIDFDDQIYFPVIKGWVVPKHDYVMVDEAQDLNPVQIELLKRSANTLIAVGDSKQAIYGFRGADPEAMNNITVAFNAITMPLSICYRCSKSVVQEAQKIVSYIEYHEDAVEGKIEQVNHSAFDANIKEGDYVLCRTTAPVVKGALQMIASKRKAVVKGRQIGEGLLQIVKYAGDLETYEREQRARLSESKNDLKLVEFEDQMETIKALIEAYGLSGLEAGINELFSDTATGIIFSTIHRSKGLETKNVWLLHPELLPHPNAKKDWQHQQEMNLKYIAITRAKENFYYVKD